MHIPVQNGVKGLILSLLFIPTLLFAQTPPANDSLCNAIALTINGTCNGIANATNLNATVENNEPVPFCSFAGQSTTVWFSFVAPAGGLVDITTDFFIGNLFDSQMAVYELPNGDCTDMLDLIEIGCDQNGGSVAFGGGMAEMRNVPVTPNTTYYVQVDGIGGFIQGDFCIEVRDSPPVTPGLNDTLCQAPLITVGDTCTSLFNFVGMSVEPNEPIGSCSFNSGQSSAWFKFVGPPSGAAIVTLNLPAPAGTLFEAHMTIYTLPSGNLCDNLLNLNEVACSIWDYPFQGGYSFLPTIGTSFTPGDTFYVQIAGLQEFGNYNPTEGSYCIEVREVPLPPNDDPCNAISLPVDGIINEGSNIGATADFAETNIAPPIGDPTTDGVNGQWQDNFVEHSVWYTFVAPASGNVQVDLTNVATLARFNTQVALYSATDCNNFNTFTLEGANDDDQFSPLSRLNQYCLTPGDTYYIMIEGVPGFLADEGNFLIRLLDIFTSPLQAEFLTKDPSCPGLTDGSALAVSTTGGSGNYSFSWSTGDTTESVLNGLGAGPVTVDISDDCDTALVETIVLNDPPSLGINATPDQLICAGDSIQLGGIPLEMGGTPAETERFYMIDFNFASPGYGLNVHKSNFPEDRTLISDQIDFGSYSMTIDPSGQFIYLLARFSNLLQRFDLGTNQIEDLGIVNPNSTDQFWTGLSFDHQANVLYIIAGEGPATQSFLYEVTPIPQGSTVSLVSTTEMEAPVWIAVDTFGVMYSADFFSDSLYIVIQATGERIGVGSLDLDATLSTDAAFDPSSNRLYLNHTNDFEQWSYYEIDPLLGPATLIFPYVDALNSGAIAIAPETVAPYTYLWGPAPGLSSTIVPDPTAFPSFTTTYFANVTDGCNTTVVDTIVVEVGQAPIAALSSTPDNGTSNGSATVNLTGGTPPFTYAWSNGGDSSTIADLDSGTYAVTITDSAGCVVSDSIEVSSNVSVDDLVRAGLGTLEIFPNPTEAQLTIRAKLQGHHQVSLRLTDLRGKAFRSTWPQAGRFYEQTLDLSGLAKGVYLLTIQTDQGQVQERIVLH